MSRLQCQLFRKSFQKLRHLIIRFKTIYFNDGVLRNPYTFVSTQLLLSIVTIYFICFKIKQTRLIIFTQLPSLKNLIGIKNV